MTNDKCMVSSKNGRCSKKPTRLITVNGARVWVCGECYEDKHKLQPTVIDQHWSLWRTD